MLRAGAVCMATLERFGVLKTSLKPPEWGPFSLYAAQDFSAKVLKPPQLLVTWSSTTGYSWQRATLALVLPQGTDVQEVIKSTAESLGA